MNIFSFLKQFPSESACKEHFLAQRIKKGIICKKCQNTKHYWLAEKEQFQCSQCRFRTTLRSGTALQSSKLPYLYWYTAIHLMTATKKGFSAHELKRQLGHKRYEPIWYLMQKIRAQMNETQEDKKLDDIVSIDDAYITTHTEKSEKNKLKRGKGSQNKSKTTLMIETTPLEKENKISHFMGRVKIVFNPQESKNVLNKIAENHIAKTSVIISDKSSSYIDLKNNFEENIQIKADEAIGTMMFHWINVTIANLKRFLLGIYHSIHETYIQHYLDEFTFKLNNRKRSQILEYLILKSV